VPGIDFNTLRNEITMEQVLELIHFAPSSRLGDQWRGPCPVHQSASSRSRSLSVNLSTRRSTATSAKAGETSSSSGLRSTGSRSTTPPSISVVPSVGRYPGSHAGEQQRTEEKRHRYSKLTSNQRSPLDYLDRSSRNYLDCAHSGPFGPTGASRWRNVLGPHWRNLDGSL